MTVIASIVAGHVTAWAMLYGMAQSKTPDGERLLVPVECTPVLVSYSSICTEPSYLATMESQAEIVDRLDSILPLTMQSQKRGGLASYEARRRRTTLPAPTRLALLPRTPSLPDPQPDGLPARRTTGTPCLAAVGADGCDRLPP